MVRPPISWRTWAVFDFMRVPPPAASTITVRSLPMGTNLIPETGASVIVREEDPVGSPGRGPAEGHSPVGLLVRGAAPLGGPIRDWDSPAGLPGRTCPPPGGPNLARIPRLVCRAGR